MDGRIGTRAPIWNLCAPNLPIAASSLGLAGPKMGDGMQATAVDASETSRQQSQPPQPQGIGYQIWA